MPAVNVIAKEPPARTSIAARLLNLFAAPGEVFDEVISSPVTPANWIVPVLLVWLTGLLPVASNPQNGPSDWSKLWCLATGLAALGGTFWSTFMLWTIGRLFLKRRFSCFKALEVVGLASTILALGNVVTSLLVNVTGDPTARPAFSMFVQPESRAYALLGCLNLFHIWAVSLLIAGLSRLSGISVKETTFWVVGYWLLTKLGLILLT
jgi:hypothetical protein